MKPIPKKSISIFQFNDTQVRSLEINGEPWWVLVDVCQVLGLSDASKVASRLEDYEKDEANIRDPIGRQQNTIIISESGLYSVTLTSRKPIAREFKKWLTTEVLPSIRKYGFYDPKRLKELSAILLEDQSHDIGVNRSKEERLMDEIHRFERENNTQFEITFKHIMPAWVIKAVKNEMMGTIPTLVKNDRWVALLSCGFDLKYILWGQRTITDTEREITAAYRSLTPEGRKSWLLQARDINETLKLKGSDEE
jgi:prophage antirepressor-like protein